MKKIINVMLAIMLVGMFSSIAKAQSNPFKWLVEKKLEGQEIKDNIIKMKIETIKILKENNPELKDFRVKIPEEWGTVLNYERFRIETMYSILQTVFSENLYAKSDEDALKSLMKNNDKSSCSHRYKDLEEKFKEEKDVEFIIYTRKMNKSEDNVFISIKFSDSLYEVSITKEYNTVSFARRLFYNEYL